MFLPQLDRVGWLVGSGYARLPPIARGKAMMALNVHEGDYRNHDGNDATTQGGAVAWMGWRYSLLQMTYAAPLSYAAA